LKKVLARYAFSLPTKLFFGKIRPFLNLKTTIIFSKNSLCLICGGGKLKKTRKAMKNGEKTQFFVFFALLENGFLIGGV
jgi:hypothetical protein